jgi:hypothetical protein
MRRIELNNIRSSDISVVVSHTELEYLKSIEQSLCIEWLPLHRKYVGSARTFYERSKSAVFIGGYNHYPNVDAAKFVAHEIWPRVRLQDPEIELVIAGSNMPAEVKNLETQGIKTIGFVDDLTGFFESARISLAPLRYGAGQKGKVLSSLSHDLPVICTPIAAEGIFSTMSSGIVISENADDFADKVVYAANDESLWKMLSQEARSFALTRETSLLNDRLKTILLQATKIHAPHPNISITRKQMIDRKTRIELSIILLTRGQPELDPAIINSWIDQVGRTEHVELIILSAGDVSFKNYITAPNVVEVLSETSPSVRLAKGLGMARGAYIRFASDDDPILSSTVGDLLACVKHAQSERISSFIGDFLIKTNDSLTPCVQVYHNHPKGVIAYNEFINSAGAIPAFYSIFPIEIVREWNRYISDRRVPFSYMDWLLTTLAFASTAVIHPDEKILPTIYDNSNWRDSITSEFQNLKQIKSSGLTADLLPFMNIFWMIDAIDMLRTANCTNPSSVREFEKTIYRDQRQRLVSNLETRLKIIGRETDKSFLQHFSGLIYLFDGDDDPKINEIRSALEAIVIEIFGAIPPQLNNYFSPTNKSIINTDKKTSARQPISIDSVF